MCGNGEAECMESRKRIFRSLLQHHSGDATPLQWVPGPLCIFDHGESERDREIEISFFIYFFIYFCLSNGVIADVPCKQVS